MLIFLDSLKPWDISLSLIVGCCRGHSQQSAGWHWERGRKRTRLKKHHHFLTWNLKPLVCEVTVEEVSCRWSGGHWRLKERDTHREKNKELQHTTKPCSSFVQRFGNRIKSYEFLSPVTSQKLLFMINLCTLSFAHSKNGIVYFEWWEFVGTLWMFSIYFMYIKSIHYLEKQYHITFQDSREYKMSIKFLFSVDSHNTTCRNKKNRFSLRPSSLSSLEKPLTWLLHASISSVTTDRSFSWVYFCLTWGSLRKAGLPVQEIGLSCITINLLSPSQPGSIQTCFQWGHLPRKCHSEKNKHPQDRLFLDDKTDDNNFIYKTQNKSQTQAAMKQSKQLNKKYLTTRLM